MWPLLRPQPHLALKTNVSLGPYWLNGPACPLCTVCSEQSVQCLDERLSLLLYSGREQYLKPLGRHYTAERRIKGQEMQHSQLLTNGEGTKDPWHSLKKRSCKLSCLLQRHTCSICAKIMHACTTSKCILKTAQWCCCFFFLILLWLLCFVLEIFFFFFLKRHIW